MDRKDYLPFSPPALGEEELDEVIDTLQSNWITTGPKTMRFERAFSNYLGAPSALGLNSCTAALHLALITLGLGEGDEVITTPNTFAASVNVVEHVRARPVLVDVEEETLNIDVKCLETKISPRTKAIMPVHFAGHPADMEMIESLAQQYGLHVIEDAAHAFPAKYRGSFIGSGKNPTAFSFYATKNLTTGEGGMLTGSKELLEKARLFSLHGMNRDAWKRYEKGGSWFYEIVYPGFKYNMSDIQAAIGLQQLKKIQGFQNRRLEIVETYNRAFSVVEALQTPVEKEEVEHAWHLYVLRLRPGMLSIDRNRFIEELGKKNIGTSVHFIPLHLHPYYRKKYRYKDSDYPVAYSNYQRVISLPLHPGLEDGDVNDVIEAVYTVVKQFKR